MHNIEHTPACKKCVDCCLMPEAVLGGNRICSIFFRSSMLFMWSFPGIIFPVWFGEKKVIFVTWMVAGRIRRELQYFSGVWQLSFLNKDMNLNRARCRWYSPTYMQSLISMRKNLFWIRLGNWPPLWVPKDNMQPQKPVLWLTNVRKGSGVVIL